MMANVNPNNDGFASGRLVQDPKVWENDKTATVKVKLALEHTYPGADGNYGADFIEFTGFVRKDENWEPAKGIGVYSHIGKGDRVNLKYQLRNNNWTDKDGVAHYETQIVIVPGSLVPQETKDVRGARKSQPTAEAPEAPVAVAQPAPAPAPTPEPEPGNFAGATPATDDDLDDVLAQLGIR